MRDEPISGRHDPKYSIRYDEKARMDYEKFFKNNEDDVIFLNGKWGSGKTSYINVVLENNRMKKLKFKLKKIKVIDLWKISTNQSTSEICYRKIFPCSGYIKRYIFFLLFLICSGLAFSLSKIDTKAFKDSAVLLLFMSGFLSGITQILGKINYDEVFLKGLKWRTKILWRRRIIVIDDFDRIDPIRQEELYKIFNLITSKKIKFIFLGDYSMIQKSEGGYLQKIIDRRMELPYELSPSNFWPLCFSSLIKKIETKRGFKISKTEKSNLEDLQKELIVENRSLREKKIFEDYVEELMFSEDRYDKINIDQQFLTIYLYLFHSSDYNKLVSNIEVLLAPKSSLGFIIGLQNNLQQKEKLKDITDDAIKVFGGEKSRTNQLILSKLLCYDDLINSQRQSDYQYEKFSDMFPNYLVNYVPVNIGGKYIREMLSKPYDRVSALAVLKKDKDSEIFKYLRRNQHEFTELEKNNLLTLALDFIIHQDDKYAWDRTLKSHGLRKELESIIHMAFYLNTNFNYKNKNEARKYLQELAIKQLDVSAQIRFYDQYLYIIPLDSLASQKEEIENIGNIKEQSYPEYIFHYILASKGSLSDKELKVLISLTDQQFHHFLCRYATVRGNEATIVLDEIVQEEQLDKVKSRFESLPKDYKENIELISKVLND